MDASRAELIIKGGTILCMDAGMRVLNDHQIAIRNGKIVDIYPSGNPKYLADKEIDATNCIVMPGLINTHTHLPMTYFRGLADDLPLEKWLNDFIWPLEAKLLDAAMIHDASLHGAAEMIKNGITQTHDMYFNMPAIADACTTVGLRAIIGEAVLEFGRDPEAIRSGLGNAVNSLKQRYAGNPLVDFNLAPHSIYGCSTETLRKCAQLAQEKDILLHMHLSETKGEVEQCLAQHGKRPVHYLADLGFLDSRAVYAHGVWLDRSEIEVLSQSPASIAMCIDSNLKLASGIMPLAEYREYGVNVCMATDGVASNNNLDILAEMDTAAKLHKAINADPAFLPAVELVKMATVNAANAIGVADQRGHLDVGMDADICVLNLDELECRPLYNPYSHVVYAMSSRNVRDVVINGEVVLERGRLTKVDEAELLHTADLYQTRIKEELKR